MVSECEYIIVDATQKAKIAEMKPKGLKFFCLENYVCTGVIKTKKLHSLCSVFLFSIALEKLWKMLFTSSKKFFFVLKIFNLFYFPLLNSKWFLNLFRWLLSSFWVVSALRPATLLRKSLWRRCFPVNFTKFLRTPFFIEHLRWLLWKDGPHKRKMLLSVRSPRLWGMQN